MQKEYIVEFDVKDIALSPEGRLRIEWADRQMPVLRGIRERFLKEKPLAGLKIGACLHVTTETANLMRTLKDGGAEVALCASNPLSTQDDAAASLVEDFGISTFSIKGEDTETYYKHINQCLDLGPNITMDDGADLISVLHTDRKDMLPNVLAGTEETTTGVIRLKSMAEQNVLLFPVIAVNDALTKHLFDNRYGTGQSTLDGLMRATNVLVAGKNFIISGYGWCGRGLASRAEGMGANVIVVEVDPLKALEAVMDGYRVMPSLEAATIADIWITVTGDINVVAKRHFEVMKDGAIVGNTGHFNVEIEIDALDSMAESRSTIRNYVEEFKLKDGRTIYLLAEGRLLNLAAAEGHPSSVMDMSFANQALSAEYVYKNYKSLEKKVYSVPKDIDNEIARLKLLSMGIKVDKLTEEQEKYLNSWDMGT